MADSVASRPFVFPVVIVIIVTLLRLSGTVNSDVSWQLWIAARLHAGATLYSDIIEVNPPLWFWMALPVDRVATLLHLRADAVLIVAIGCLAALSLVATNQLLSDLSGRRRALLLAYGALILTAMPWMEVGQREQLVLIGTVPYAALIAARRESCRVSTMLALLVGASAALGFALKHYFLVVPVLLELWVLLDQRKKWRPIRPETAGIIGFGIAYAATILLFAPKYLTAIVPVARLAYGVTGAPRLVDLLQPAVLVGSVTLLLAGIYHRRLRAAGSGFGFALLIASAGFLLAYLLQAKGWTYHALPLLGCSSIGLAALLASAPKQPRLIGLAAPALLLMPFAIAGQGILLGQSPTLDLQNAVSGLRPGDSVGFLATDPALGWPITLQRRLRSSSRYNGFWMMRAVVTNEQLGGPEPRLTALGDSVIEQTVADFRCIPPIRIIVARPQPGEEGFDILPFFLRNSDFAQFLSHYRLKSRTTLATYEMAEPIAALPPRLCHKGM